MYFLRKAHHPPGGARIAAPGNPSAIDLPIISVRLHTKYFDKSIERRLT
jgi:hypothetical protein